MYRDDTAAARVHLAMLERQIAQQRSVSTTLKSYRNALVDELQRLEHAVIWYVNGEKYGFNDARRKDDLSPARRTDAVPSQDSIAAAVFNLPHDQVATRTAEILRELAVKDPGSDQLQHQVRALETQCAELRRQVEELAARHPDHPPPPEYKASIWTVVVPVGFLAAAIAAATLLIF
jgi:septal ring factor EnvC (AmiA/AmiB activator)